MQLVQKIIIFISFCVFLKSFSVFFMYGYCLGLFPGRHLFLSILFSFLSILMLNYHILAKWNYQKNSNYHSLTFYKELYMKNMGWG